MIALNAKARAKDLKVDCFNFFLPKFLRILRRAAQIYESSANATNIRNSVLKTSIKSTSSSNLVPNYYSRSSAVSDWYRQPALSRFATTRNGLTEKRGDVHRATRMENRFCRRRGSTAPTACLQYP